jgi:hypothetical protein
MESYLKKFKKISENQARFMYRGIYFSIQDLLHENLMIYK